MLLELAPAPPHASAPAEALELVRCPTCRGTGDRSYEQRFGRRSDVVSRACRDCSGTGKVLRGDPLATGYVLTLDYREKAAA